jgi:hypothetical protein
LTVNKIWLPNIVQRNITWSRYEFRYRCIDVFLDNIIIGVYSLLFGRAVCGRSPAEIAGSNPTGGMDVCCECCVLSGRGLCDELITLLEESYRLWCVVVCDLETSRMRSPRPALGRSAPPPPKAINTFKAMWNFLQFLQENWGGGGLKGSQSSSVCSSGKCNMFE